MSIAVGAAACSRGPWQSCHVTNVLTNVIVVGAVACPWGPGQWCQVTHSLLASLLVALLHALGKVESY